MDLKTARPRAGRSLGWSDEDLQTLPYAHHWNPVMGELAPHIRHALHTGGVAEPLVPDLAEIDLRDHPTPNGYTMTRDGAFRIALVTEMPDVTPEMVDWWFGWHGDEPARYKLWHPRAHVHAEWASPPPEGEYIGYTSLVDEYVGSELGRYAIQFREPTELGVHVEQGSVAVCARVGLVDVPVDAGYLVHLVEPVPGGSVMRSFFWVGAPYAAARATAMKPALPIIKRVARPTEQDARDLLVHCSQEMPHLATFLPTLFKEQST